MEEVEQHARGVYGKCQPESCGVAPEVLGDAASGDDSQPDAQVPRGEDRRVGRAAPLVRREVDEHGLHRGVHVSIAESDEQRRGIVSVDVRHGAEGQVPAQREQHARRGVVDDLPFAQRLAPDDAREDQPAGQQHEEGSRSRGDVQHLLAVDGDVGRDDAEREGEGRDADALAPALEQDETVERNLALLADRLPLAAFDRRVDGQPREGDDQREGEEQVEVVHRVVEVEARRGADRHGDVVAQSVVSDPFGAARGVEHVDGHRAAGHGRGAERRAVHRAHHGEEEQRAGDVVAREEQREAEVADQQHLLAGETVDDKPAEGPHGKGREGVAAEDESDHRLVGRKGVAQEERQQRRQQIEREKKHEVGDPHLQVVAVPQCRPRRAVPVVLLRHHRRMFLVSADRFSRFAALPLSLFPSSPLSRRRSVRRMPAARAVDPRCKNSHFPVPLFSRRPILRLGRPCGCVPRLSEKVRAELRAPRCGPPFPERMLPPGEFVPNSDFLRRKALQFGKMNYLCPAFRVRETSRLRPPEKGRPAAGGTSPHPVRDIIQSVQHERFQKRLDRRAFPLRTRQAGSHGHGYGRARRASSAFAA